MEQKRVSEFAGRRSREPEPGTVPAQDQPAPRAGDFKRNPCGACWHWQPNPRAGLNMGRCMAAPPVSLPVPGQGGTIGNLLSRPTMPDSYEGCDLWSDESEFEDGPGELDGAQLATGTEG